VEGKQVRQGKAWYLVNCKGYGHEDNMWELEENLQNVRRAVRDYESQDRIPREDTMLPKNGNTRCQHPNRDGTPYVVAALNNKLMLMWQEVKLLLSLPAQ
jgi:hypothetical protein